MGSRNIIDLNKRTFNQIIRVKLDKNEGYYRLERENKEKWKRCLEMNGMY